MKDTLYYSEEGDLVRSLGNSEVVKVGDFKGLFTDAQAPNYDGKKVKLKDDDPIIGKQVHQGPYYSLYYRVVVHHATIEMVNSNLRPNVRTLVREQLEKGNVGEVLDWVLGQCGNIDTSLLMHHDKLFHDAMTYYAESMKFMHIEQLFSDWLKVTIRHIDRKPHDLTEITAKSIDNVKDWATRALNANKLTKALEAAQKYIVLLEDTLENNRVKIPDENEICPGEDPLDVVVTALRTVDITGTNI